MTTYWAAHSAYDMFSWYKYLIVNLVFSHLGFWSGNLLPDRCLLVPSQDHISVIISGKLGGSQDRSEVIFGGPLKYSVLGIIVRTHGHSKMSDVAEMLVMRK